MKRFLKSTAIITLAAIILPAAPGMEYMPILGDIIVQEAEASNIRRRRVRLRRGKVKSRPTLLLRVITQTDPEDTVEAAWVELSASTLDEGGNVVDEALLLDIQNPAETTATYIIEDDSVIFGDNGGGTGTATIRLTATVNVEYTTGGGQRVLETVTIEDAESGISLDIIRGDDGSTRLRFSGAADAMGAFNAEDPAPVTLSRNDEEVGAATFRNMRQIWRADAVLADDACPEVGAEAEGSEFTNICQIRAFDAAGNLLDESVAEFEPVIEGPQVTQLGIRGTRLQQRRNGDFRMRSVTRAPLDDAELTVTQLDLQLSHSDGIGNIIEEPVVTLTEPQRLRAFSQLPLINDDDQILTFDNGDSNLSFPAEGPVPVTWISPVFGDVNLELDVLPRSADREDGQMGAIICDGEIVEQRVRGCQPIRIALVDHRGDGSSLQVSLAGRPGAFGAGPFTTALYGEILISGEPIKFDEDRIWFEEPPTATPAALDGMSYMLSAVGSNEGGDIVDISSVEGIAGQQAIAIPAFLRAFARSFVSVSDNGNIVLETSITASQNPVFVGAAGAPTNILSRLANGGGTPFISMEDLEERFSLLDVDTATPFTREAFALWPELTAGDFDNVVGESYSVTFDAYLPGSDDPQSVSVDVIPDELSGSGELTIASVFEDDVMLIGVNVSLNEDGETFTMQARASREDGTPAEFIGNFEEPSESVQLVFQSIEPTDGGAEFDLFEEARIPSEAGEQLFFRVEGNRGLGSLLSEEGGSVLITGNPGAVEGEGVAVPVHIRLDNLTFNDPTGTGLTSATFGFGKGTKRSTSSTASARPELQ